MWCYGIQPPTDLDTCDQRLKTLKRVRTYVLEAENETGQFDIVVHNPVTEIVSVYQEMLARKEVRFPTPGGLCAMEAHAATAVVGREVRQDQGQARA